MMTRFRAVVSLSSGSIGAQLISGALMVFSLPGYGPAPLGEIALYLFIKNLLSHIVILKACSSVLRVRPGIATLRLAASALLTCLTISLLSFLLTFAGYVTVGNPQYIYWLVLAPTLLVGGGSDFYSAVRLRHGNSVRVGRARLLQAAVTGALLFLFSHLWPTTTSIAIAYLLGYAASMYAVTDLSLMASSFRIVRVRGPRAFRPKVQDATYTVGISIVQTVANYGLPALVAATAGPELGGCYVAASRLLSPVIILSRNSASVAQAFESQRSIAYQAEKNLIDKYWKAVVVALVLAVASAQIAILNHGLFENSDWLSVDGIAAAMLCGMPLLILFDQLEAMKLARAQGAMPLLIRSVTLGFAIASYCALSVVFGMKVAVVLLPVALANGFTIGSVWLVLHLFAMRDSGLWRAVLFAAVALTSQVIVAWQLVAAFS